MKRLATAIAIIVMCLSMALGAVAQSADSDSSEYLIKAGFVYNFAKFVEWPPNAFAQPTSPIVIGVLGDDSFTQTLQRIVKDKKIESHPFVVKTVKWGKDVKDCNILFVTTSEKAHSDEIVQMAKGTSILTIGETPGFAKRGGIINFTLEDSKVRFEVNVDAAKQADLNISSRLLSLAKIVQESVASARRSE